MAPPPSPSGVSSLRVLPSSPRRPSLATPRSQGASPRAGRDRPLFSAARVSAVDAGRMAVVQIGDSTLPYGPSWQASQGESQRR
jgi:hypothetical protein